MNWEAIGAIGEIVGALAVVGSLIYLATQIRISNNSAKQAGMQELMHETMTFLGRLNSDKETAHLWIRGLLHSKDLDDAEVSQFASLCLEITIIWERLYYMQSSNIIEPHLLHVFEMSRRRIAAAPGYWQWFKNARQQFTEEFGDLIEKESTEGSEFVPAKDNW